MEERLKFPLLVFISQRILSWPPKSYVDRLFNVVQWNEFESGGHFAALEEPDTLIKDIRNFFKVIK